MTGQGFASKTKLNGVWIARRNFDNSADFIISDILFPPACAPKAGPFSLYEAETQTIDDTLMRLISEFSKK